MPFFGLYILIITLALHDIHAGGHSTAGLE